MKYFLFSMHALTLELRMTPSVCCCLLIPSSLGNTFPQTFMLSVRCVVTGVVVGVSGCL